MTCGRILDLEAISVLTAAREYAWREVLGSDTVAPHTDLWEKLATLIVAVAENGQRDPTKLRAYAVTFLKLALPHKLKSGPKFRNPANESETWVGRGMRPRWLQAALKDGHKIEEFAVSKW